jgi:hypothetical protein
MLVDGAVEDWQPGELIVVPHAWRDDGLWQEIQKTAQERISTNLQTMYSGLINQPMSPALLDMAREIERRLDVS